MAMRSIRLLAAAGAAMAIALVVSSANAQTAASDQPGPPMHLLAGLTPPHEHAKREHAKQAHVTHRAETHEAKAIGHARTARHKSAAHDTVQAADAAPPAQPAIPTPPAPAANPETASPAATTTPPLAQTIPADFAAVEQATPASDALQENAVVVNGQTVQIASPDDVNDIDRAADTAPPSQVAQNGSDGAPAQPALSTIAQQDTGLSASRNRSSDQKASDQKASAVGSASWIAQVLAALGGAVTAGTVAWFLIGGGPQRSYG
jgi:hypothetical protein